MTPVSRTLLIPALGAVVAATLTGCFAFGIDGGPGNPGTPEGTSEPNAVSSQVNRLGAILHPIETRGLDAEQLVLKVAELDSTGWGAAVAVLEWEGAVTAEGARLLIRVTPTEGAPDPECFEYTVTDVNVAIEERSCPDTATPPLPSPKPLPALDDAAQALVLATLKSATPESLATDFEKAFPEAHFTRDTEILKGELIVAIGVPSRKDCVLAIKSRDGKVERASFDPVWLEPGELGCSTRLYTSPPL